MVRKYVHITSVHIRMYTLTVRAIGLHLIVQRCVLVYLLHRLMGWTHVIDCTTVSA